jgi:glutamate synthase (NADPH/NADH) small chain
VIIGGGDTGADCLGTAHRQGARSVTQLEILPAPPDQRAADNPWPIWHRVLRTSSAHEEGGARVFSARTSHLRGDDTGQVRALVLDDGRERPADLVLLAMGFVGVEKTSLLEQLGVRFTPAGTVWRDAQWMTSVPGVFVAGDMQRGQSLIVWALDDGRRAAAAIDCALRSGGTAAWS